MGDYDYDQSILEVNKKVKQSFQQTAILIVGKNLKLLFEITFLTCTFAIFALGLNSLMAGGRDPTALILGVFCLGFFIYIRSNK